MWMHCTQRTAGSMFEPCRALHVMDMHAWGNGFWARACLRKVLAPFAVWSLCACHARAYVPVLCGSVWLPCHA